MEISKIWDQGQRLRPSGEIDDLQGKVAEYKELHVYMPKALLENPNIEKDWILKIKAKYLAISNIVISSIEKELNLL